MIIRDANFKDADNIVDINIVGWQETYYGIFPSDFLDNLVYKRGESIKKCINKINQYVVCVINNEVVGFIRFGMNKKGYNNNYAEVYAIYVNSKFQKLGVGRKLLNYTFNKLKKDYDYVLISTLQENSANIFYQKCGGKKIGTSIFRIGDNEYVENLYLYSMSNL